MADATPKEKDRDYFLVFSIFWWSVIGLGLAGAAIFFSITHFWGFGIYILGTIAVLVSLATLIYLIDEA